MAGRADTWVLAGVLLASIAAGVAWWQVHAQAADAALFPHGSYAYVDGEPDQLFRAAPPGAASAKPTVSAVAGSHPIRISREAARNAVERGSVSVVLPDSTRFDVRFEREEFAATGDWTFIGRVLTPFGELASVLTFGPDGVFGTLPAPDGRMFHVTTSHGTSIIAPAGDMLPPGKSAADPYTIDFRIAGQPSSAPGATPLADARGHAAAATRSIAVVDAHPAPPVPAAQSGEAVTIDILGVYTSDLVALRGSVSAAETEFVNLLAVADQAYRDSQTVVRLRLAGLQQTDYPPENGMEQALDDITENRLPDGLDVHAARDAVSADLVAMLRPFQQGSNICGIAWLNGGSLQSNYPYPWDGFSVSAVDPCGPLVIAHEIGHNLGSMHDIATATFWDVQYGAFPFSFGYRRPGHDGFATVMAYTSGEPWIGRFSDPGSWACADGPCGTRDADNVRSLNLMAEKVANFGVEPGMLTVSDWSTIESDEYLWFMVRLSSPAPEGGVSFDFTTSDGTASAGTDYVAEAGRHKILKGHDQANFVVRILPDDVVEPDESIRFSLSNVEGAGVADGEAVGWILDEDPRPAIRGRLVFPTGAPLPSAAVNARLYGTEGSPYASGSIEIRPPAFEYEIGVVEGFEAQMVIEAADPYSAQVVEFGTVRHDVRQDVVMQLAAEVSGRVLIAEGEPVPGQLRITVDQSGAPGELGFSYSVTALPPDFAYSLRAAPGRSSALVVEDPPKPFARQSILLGVIEADLVQDIELRREPSITVAHYGRSALEWGEGQNGGVSLLVWLPSPAPAGVSFDVATVDGTAKAGQDYVAHTGTIKFLKGARAASVQLEFIGDDVPEPDETFRVVLSNPTGGWIAGDQEIEIEIVDDDHAYVVAGDANNDGISDLYWHSVSAGRFAWWLMDGAGVRESGRQDTKRAFEAVAGGDFGGDRNLDLVWVDQDNSEVFLWTREHDPYHFDPYIYYPVQIEPHPGPAWRAVGGADLDGDGHADLIWLDESGRRLQWWRFRGFSVGGSGAIDIPDGLTLATTGDLDGDGRDELLWRKPGTEALWSWRPVGSYGAPARLAPDALDGWTLVGAFDLDGNGNDELLWHDPGHGRVEWWDMQGLERVGRSRKRVPTDFRIASTGDYDGDGRVDLVWRDVSRTELWLWRSVPDGFEASAIGAHPAADYAPVQPWLPDAATGAGGVGGSLSVGDLDGNGHDDMLWYNAELGQLDWWRMHYGRRAGLWGSLVAGGDVAGTGDFDGDGRTDLIVRDSPSGALQVQFAREADSFAPSSIARQAGAGWQLVAVADADGDGDDDLYWRDEAQRLRWWLMDGAQVVGEHEKRIPAGYHLLAAGDLDADGRADLLWQSVHDHKVVAWMATATGFLANRVDAWPAGSVFGALADRNGDGLPEIIWHHYGSGELVAWQLRGSHRIDTVRMGVMPAGMHVAASGDFDADRRADLVLRDRRSGGDVLRLWKGGRPSFEPLAIGDYPALPLSSPPAIARGRDGRP